VNQRAQDVASDGGSVPPEDAQCFHLENAYE
jgi:hypothetical protein